jgi:hypothetical protein
MNALAVYKDLVYKRCPSYRCIFASACGQVISMRGGKPRPLKQRENRQGYLTVRSAETPKTRVQYLVADAWLGPRPPGRWVLHRNDVGTDNRLSNLYYGTPADNASDAARNGRAGPSLTDEQGARVRALLALGVPMRKVAAFLDVSVRAVHAIKRLNPREVGG